MKKAINYTFTGLLSLLTIVFMVDLWQSTQAPQEYSYSADSYSAYVKSSIITILVLLLLFVISILQLRYAQNRLIKVLYYISLAFFTVSVLYGLYDWYKTGFDH